MIKQGAQGPKDESGGREPDSLEAVFLTTPYSPPRAANFYKELQQTFGNTLRHLLLKLSCTKQVLII